jgi:hypothetical protein
MLPRRLTLRGRDFEQVCVRRTGVAVYAGDGTYLRIGPGLAAELDMHRQMLRHGFPVATILEQGLHEQLPYYVEESLGPTTLGDVFLAEAEARGGISDQSLAGFSDVMARHARAQAAIDTPEWSADVFAELVGVTGAVALLPDIGSDIRNVFGEAMDRLDNLPGTLLHGDLHPDNTCAGGIIDLEGTGWGVLGYDVLTAVFVPGMCLVERQDHTMPATWFSSSQLRAYLRRMDEIFGLAASHPPSDHLDSLLLCRAISLCARRHPSPDIWLARCLVLRDAVEAYKAGEELAAQWGLETP